MYYINIKKINQNHEAENKGKKQKKHNYESYSFTTKMMLILLLKFFANGKYKLNTLILMRGFNDHFTNTRRYAYK
jgi:hypothetical protein